MTLPLPIQGTEPITRKIVIPITPTPQKRHRSRAFKTKTGRYMSMAYKDKSQRTNEDEIKHHMREQWYRQPIETAIRLSVKFFYNQPKSWSKKKKESTPYKITKPDLSNLVKQIEDCGNGIIWKDDNLIISYGSTCKKYTSGEERTEIEIQY